ncbi:MAG: CoB--CoM heterodisulfide reductase subunit C [Promethearchaeota archaeon]
MTEKSEPVDVSTLELGFRHKLSEMMGHDSLKNCISCGVCSSGCTVSEYIDYPPHRVVALLLLGFKDKVLQSRAIWTCSLCHKCAERCPKDVEYSLLLALLRNLAVRSGNVPEEYLRTLNTMLDGGLALPYTGFIKSGVERKRAKMGLPPLSDPAVDEVRKVLELTGLTKLVQTKEEGEKDD